ncbi:ankyrin, partial [Colletotrichum somersetense]
MKEQSQNSSNESLTNILDRYVYLERKEVAKSGPVTATAVINALSIADRKKSLQLISLTTDGLSKDDNGRTILSWAAQQGWPEIVKAAIDVGSAIDTEDKGQRTPLSYAAEHGHAEVVRILMKSGALPVGRDLFGRTPLSHASARGCVGVMLELFKDSRVITEDSDDNGHSALHWAAQEGHEAAVTLLLERGARIDKRNKGEHTPLISALLRNRTSIAKLLVEKKADVD